MTIAITMFLSSLYIYFIKYVKNMFGIYIMRSKTDVFFIILFLIVISAIIGFNIVSIIDKKISNVSVNIPPVNIAPPQIVLNIKKNNNGNWTVCDNNNNNTIVDIKLEDNIQNSCLDNKNSNLNIQNSNLNDIQDDNLNNIQDNNLNNIQDSKLNIQDSALNKDPNLHNIEPFIVADAHDFANYDQAKALTLKKKNSFPDQEVSCQKKDNVDDFSIQLSYNHEPDKPTPTDPKAYISAGDFGFEAPRQFLSCANSSIAHKWKTGNKSLLPYKIACNQPNKLTAENYYKTHYKAQIIPLEDYKVRGHNYMDYSNSAGAYSTDKRILSQSTKGLDPKDDILKHIPDGYNYAFHNTPAMRMP